MCVCLDDDKTSYDMVEAFMSKKGLCSISGSEKWDIVSLFAQIVFFEKDTYKLYCSFCVTPLVIHRIETKDL